MRFVKDFFSKLGEFSDLLKFLWSAKLWFLIPFIVILAILGFFMVFAQATGIAPFIYTLF